MIDQATIEKLAITLARNSLRQLAQETRFSKPPAVLLEQGWKQEDYHELGRLLARMADDADKLFGAP